MGAKRECEDNSVEWTGHWWLPGCSEDRLPGVLYPGAERGPALEVMGSFHAENDRDRKPLEIVHGTTPKAELVTLHNCTESAMSQDARGQYRTRYEAVLAVTGEHFSSVDSLTFQDLRIEYSTLIDWVGRPLIDEKELYTAGGAQTVKVQPPLQGRMYRGNDLVVALYYGACRKITGHGLTLHIYPGAHVALHWNTPRGLADSLAVVQRVRDFLAFATALPTHVEKIEAEAVRLTRIGHAHDMLLFHRSLAGPKTTREPFFLLFSLKDVASNLERVVSAWFEKAGKLHPVIDLHLAPVYNPQMQPENQFLAAVQALEAFHRRTRENRDLPEDEHDARIAGILGGAPEQHRTWLLKLTDFMPPGAVRGGGVRVSHGCA